MLAQAADQTLAATSIDWFAISPLLVLLGGTLVLLVVGALTPPWPKAFYAIASCVTAGAAAVLAVVLWDDVSDGGDRLLIGNALRFDRFTMLLTIILCIAVIGASMLTTDYMRREGTDIPEIYAMYLCAAIGGVVMASANDLIVLFLGLETLSIALYVLAASNRKRIESQESGLKYFVLGGFASAFLLYGISMLYGALGTTRLSSLGNPELKSIFEGLANGTITIGDNKALLLAGIALLVVGLGFKIAAVPFHMWTPDVYEGAPTPVTAFMASAAKAAAFAALIRVLTYGLAARETDWRPVIWVLAIASLVVGSVLAVVQTNVKRMLAYSSISHAGFILVGIEATSQNGTAGALFYLLSYAVMVIGTFGVVSLVGREGDGRHSLDDYRGLGKRRPLLALMFGLLLFSQAGVPLFSGFVAKFGVISAAIESKSYALAIVAMLSAVIAAFLYLRITVSMYMHDPDGDDKVPMPTATTVAIGLALLATLVLGFFPGWMIDLAKDAVPFLNR